MNELKSNIIEKIQKGEITQKSSLYFLTRTYALYISSTISLVLGMLATAGLFHSIRAEHLMTLRGVGWSYSDLPLIAQTLPYVWILSVIFLLVITWVHISHTKHSYKIQPLILICFVFFCSILGGYVLYSQGAGERLENKIRKGIPQYEQRVQNRLEGVDRVRDKYKKPKPEEILERLNQRNIDGKKYLALPGKCEVMRYTCPDNQSPFNDRRGCGCIQ